MDARRRWGLRRASSGGDQRTPAARTTSCVTRLPASSEAVARSERWVTLAGIRTVADHEPVSSRARSARFQVAPSSYDTSSVASETLPAPSTAGGWKAAQADLLRATRQAAGQVGVEVVVELQQRQVDPPVVRLTRLRPEVPRRRRARREAPAVGARGVHLEAVVRPAVGRGHLPLHGLEGALVDELVTGVEPRHHRRLVGHRARHAVGAGAGERHVHREEVAAPARLPVARAGARAGHRVEPAVRADLATAVGPLVAPQLPAAYVLHALVPGGARPAC